MLAFFDFFPKPRNLPLGGDFWLSSLLQNQGSESKFFRTDEAFRMTEKTSEGVLSSTRCMVQRTGITEARRALSLQLPELGLVAHQTPPRPSPLVNFTAFALPGCCALRTTRGPKPSDGARVVPNTPHRPASRDHRRAGSESRWNFSVWFWLAPEASQSERP
jgi:hypothetical protein